MGIPALDGITAKIITTDRITSPILFSGNESAIPVLFLHGNWSSATWWEEIMLSLPKDFRGIAPDQRGYGEAEKTKKVDATRGAGDWADDATALLDHLDIEKAHFVGCSLGGYTVWRIMMDYPERILSVTQLNPVSPFGFSGTKDFEGTPCFDDHAGTGSWFGTLEREFIQKVMDGDRRTESEHSPRISVRSIFIPPYQHPREEELLSSILAVHIGDKDIPGDTNHSKNWPYISPGIWGAYNACSPKYTGDVSHIYDGRLKVPVLWIRGSLDDVISDSSLSDTGYMGKTGVIPDWPGEDVYPPQPMIGQTRAVLEKYTTAGGSYREVVINNFGHTNFIEQPPEFIEVFHQHLMRNP
jgi:pimeloyl-ACP methyl ester carboxylesterase